MKIETLRSRRVKLRSSQYMIARLAGISRNRLSLIECSYVRATDEEVKKIKNVLNKIEKFYQKQKINPISKDYTNSFRRMASNDD